MKFKIKTSKGIYKYQLKIVYGGIKYIDKNIAKENLILFDKLAKKYSLRYGMIYGTLLGALREHDFINHDEDIDLFVLSEDRDIFKDMLFELRDNGFEVIRWDRRDGLCSIMRKGEYIDFYFFEPLYPGFRATLGDPLPEKYLTEVRYYEFQGINILAPKDAEEAMVEHYGPNWKIPYQTKNFELTNFQRLKIKIMWWFYFNMPDFIFYPWMEKRGNRKIEGYNKRAKRLNEHYGKDILEYLPLDCYKIHH